MAFPLRFLVLLLHSPSTIRSNTQITKPLIYIISSNIFYKSLTFSHCPNLNEIHVSSIRGIDIKSAKAESAWVKWTSTPELYPLSNNSFFYFYFLSIKPNTSGIALTEISSRERFRKKKTSYFHLTYTRDIEHTRKSLKKKKND